MEFINVLILFGLFIILHKIIKIDKLLHQIKESLLSKDAFFLEFYTKINGQTTKVDQMFLKVSDKLPLSVALKDKFGNEAQSDGKPSWALSDESLASLELSEDGKSALLLPKGTVGSFKVQVSADADLGEGVKSILGELDIELLAGEAVQVEIKAGEALPQ
jgi:hypothetical protein